MTEVLEIVGGRKPDPGSEQEIEAVRALLAAVDRIWAALGARVRMGTSEIVTLEALHFTSPLSTGEIRGTHRVEPRRGHRAA